eukprot:scaffold313120_cov33-Tisochrysis_lutea.AAC.1
MRFCIDIQAYSRLDHRDTFAHIEKSGLMQSLNSEMTLRGKLRLCSNPSNSDVLTGVVGVSWAGFRGLPILFTDDTKNVHATPHPFPVGDFRRQSCA